MSSEHNYGDAGERLIAVTKKLTIGLAGEEVYICSAALGRLLCLIVLQAGGSKESFLKLMGESYDLATEELEEYRAAGQDMPFTVTTGAINTNSPGGSG